MAPMLPRATLPAVLFCLSLLASPASAQTNSLCPTFNQVLAHHGIIGGAIAVIHDSAPPQTCFYGDARQATHQPIDAATSYNWASITKTMTAIAILQLRDRGKLSLDDPAVRYIPELRQVHDAYGPIDAVTIRTLLTHSAGFRNPTWPWDCDDSANCDWQPFEPTRWSQIVAMLPYTHVAFAPGTRWSYSNLGYVFLGQIIERLTGDDFEVYLTKNILMPLGMTQSYFDVSPYFLESHVSASYLRAGDKLTPQPFNFDTGITTSNSGLKSPITDMEKYAAFLLGNNPKDPLNAVVLKRSSLEEAWHGILPVTDPGEPATPYTTGSPQMGLGFFTTEIDGHRYVYHDGDQGGFSSEMFLDPARHTASILVVNTTDTGAPPPTPATHAESNTEPNPEADLRLTLRRYLINHVFPKEDEKPPQK